MLGEDGGAGDRSEHGGGSRGSTDGDDAVVRRRIDAEERKSDAVLATLTALCEESEHHPSVLALDPLYETVDVGALDDLYTDAPGSDVRVEFRYQEYRITVTDDSVLVEAAFDDDDTDGS